jgi:hypothetical protein
MTPSRDRVRKRAVALLVMSVNLLTATGFLTVTGGLLIATVGVWPVLFGGGPLDDETVRTIGFGLFWLVWGVLVLYGTSRMRDLTSYRWAMAGAILGQIPLFAGLYALIMLMHPTVKAGFAMAASDDSHQA